MTDEIDRLVQAEAWGSLADLARKQAAELHERQGDRAGDLIAANRDSILRVHEEGMRRIKKVLARHFNLNEGDSNAYYAVGSSDHRVICRIIEAVNTFHPMHAESWAGWPEGSSS